MDLSDESALLSSLRFHGSGLRRQITSRSQKNSQLPKLLNKSHEQLSRSSRKDFSIDDLNSDEERKLMIRLHGFIAEKLPVLFQQPTPADPKQEFVPCIPEENDAVYGACPPLETYIDISSRKLMDRLFAEIRPGDLVCGEIRGVEESGITIRLLCTDSMSFQRDLEDLRLNVFIPRQELSTAKAGDDPFSIYCKQKLVRAVVGGVNVDKHQLTVCIKSATPSASAVHRQLGIISESELPAYFRAAREHGSNDKYDKILRRSVGFQNPHCVGTLSQHFGIRLRSISTLSKELAMSAAEPGESGKELRKAQTSRLAMKSVVKGIERLRNNQNTEAMQHFNKALEIDPDNVEGLVGRGALYANCDSYEIAINDFNRALAVDPNHTNARLYLIETLLAQGKAHEKKRRYSNAQEFYDRVLVLSPNNDEATERLSKLKTKMMEKRKRNSSSDRTLDVSSSNEDDGRSKAKKPKSQLDASHTRRSCGSETVEQSSKLETANSYVGDPALMDKLKRYYDYYSKRMKPRHQSSTEDKEKRNPPASSSSTTGGSSDHSSSKSVSSTSTPNAKRRRKSPIRTSLNGNGERRIEAAPVRNTRTDSRGNDRRTTKNDSPEIVMDKRRSHRSPQPANVKRQASQKEKPPVVDIASPRRSSSGMKDRRTDQSKKIDETRRAERRSPPRRRESQREVRNITSASFSTGHRQINKSGSPPRRIDRTSSVNGKADKTVIDVKTPEDAKLTKQLTDMEKFIAGLKSKQKDTV